MALAANVHCSLLGKKGLREVALQSHSKAEYAKGEIARIPGFAIPYSAPTFNEFTVEAPEPAAPLLGRLARRGILAGVALSRWHPEFPNRFLVAATEMNTREEIDRLVAALQETATGGMGDRKVPRQG
jgi:glycine dehydrogenase subunit 1